MTIPHVNQHNNWTLGELIARCTAELATPGLTEEQREYWRALRTKAENEEYDREKIMSGRSVGRSRGAVRW